MRPLFNFEQFSLIETVNSSFSSEIDAVFESLAAVVGNPVKYTKIKNNAKKYQKALVTKALADVEYEKKRKGSLEPKQKEVLAAATKAKKQAMDDLASAVSQRMDDLATTEPLKNVAKLAKTKAKISAAETSLKSADKAETAELKSKISKMKTASSNIEQELKKAEKKTDAKEEAKPSNEDKIAKLEKDIDDYEINIQAEMEMLLKDEAKLEKAKKDQKASTDPESYNSKIIQIQRSMEESKDDIQEMKDAQKKLKAELKKLNV